MSVSLLVQACARAHGLPTRGLPAGPRSLGALDGPRLTTLARYHKVSEELRVGLSGMDWAPAEETKRALARQVFAGRAFRGMVLSDWARITEAFADSGVRVLTLKGPAVSLQLYGDAHARDYGDLDLLVHPGDFGRATGILRDLGYAAMAGYGSRPNVRFASTVHHVPFGKAGRPFPVELHERLWKFDETDKRLSFDDLYDRSATVVHENRTYRTLGPVDHAVFQLMHGAGHAWCLLRWVVDAAMILHFADETTQGGIVDRCDRLGIGHLVALAAGVVDSMFPLRDAGSRQRGFGGCPKSAVHYALARVRGASGPPRTMVALTRYFVRYLLGIAPTLRSKALVLTRLLMVNNADVAAVPLPAVFSFLYLPLRPVLVLARRLKRLLEKIEGTQHA